MADSMERREILQRCKMLKPDEFRDLVFLLEVPVRRQPSKALDVGAQISHLLDWAVEDKKRLQKLVDELRRSTPEQTDGPKQPLENEGAVKIWRKKLEFLLEQEPTTVEATAKFKLQHDIEEARQKLRGFGVDA